jgi:O-antigen ligase
MLPKRIRKAYIAVLAMVLIILFLVSLVFPFTNEIIEQVKVRIDPEYLSDESRFELLKMDIEIIKDRYIFGHGYGTHSRLAKYKYNLVSLEGIGAGSHNFLVTVWSGAGIFALTTMVYLLIYSHRRILAVWKKYALLKCNESIFVMSIYVSFVGMILHGLLFPLIEDNTNFYLILALLSSYIVDFER